MRTINMAITKDNGNYVICEATIDGRRACECKIDIDKTGNEIKWEVSSWFTVKEFKNQGIGKKTMSRLVSYCKAVHGYPTQVTYVWNGENEYVLDWMERNFEALCTCPIAVQKTQSDDDWSSHVYELSVLRFLSYFSYC